MIKVETGNVNQIRNDLQTVALTLAKTTKYIRYVELFLINRLKLQKRSVKNQSNIFIFSQIDDTVKETQRELLEVIDVVESLLFNVGQCLDDHVPPVAAFRQIRALCRIIYGDRTSVCGDSKFLLRFKEVN